MNSFAPSLQSPDASFPVFSSFITRRERCEFRSLGERTRVNPQPAPAPQTPGPALRPVGPRQARGRVRSVVRGEGAPLRSPLLPTGERTPQSCVSARLRVASPAPSLSPQTILESLMVSVTYSHPQVPVPKPPFSAFQQNSARVLPPPAPNITRSNLPQAAPVQHYPARMAPRTRVRSSLPTRAAHPLSPGLCPRARTPTLRDLTQPTPPRPQRPSRHRLGLFLSWSRTGQHPGDSSLEVPGRTSRAPPATLGLQTFAPPPL